MIVKSLKKAKKLDLKRGDIERIMDGKYLYWSNVVIYYGEGIVEGRCE